MAGDQLGHHLFQVQAMIEWIFMLVGVLVGLAVVGAIVGIPLAIIDFLLVIRRVF